MSDDLTIPLTRTLDMLERGIVLEDMQHLTQRDMEIIREQDLTYDPDECAWVAERAGGTYSFPYGGLEKFADMCAHIEEGTRPSWNHEGFLTRID